jgi:general secretion pathway protein E
MSNIHANERRLRLNDILPYLVIDGFLVKSQADELQIMWDRVTGTNVTIHPLVWLVNKKLSDRRDTNEYFTIENLTVWLARRLDIPYLRIDPLKIDLDAVTGVVSQAYATRFSILPVQVGEREIIFATCEPFLREWERELSRILRKEIKRVLASPLDIARYQDELFGLSQSMQRARVRTSEFAKPVDITDIEALVELGKAGKLDANDHHIVHIVDWLLQFAFDQRASDIHIEPRREIGNVRFRIDGVLQTVYQMPALILGAVTARIKAIGRMDVVERRRSQDGRLKTRTPSGQEVEMRLSIMPTAFGEKLVMRIFDPQVLLRDMDKLGLSVKDSQHWEEMTAKTHGIILVTGPTGSGKTTTLYTTLKRLASPEVNVSTIEDPVEMVEPSFNQMQVNPSVNVDFASGVRTLLRQDPDIIMVGEIRDLETAEMAIQAALTGHLVLSTLHTNDAVNSITRLLNLGVPPYLISATLIGVMAQRLVRTLCSYCKQPLKIEQPLWESLVGTWALPMPNTVQQTVGCIECRNTGYKGRMGLYEILRLTPAMRAHINAQPDIEAIKRLAYADGMEPLRISGARKVKAGQTTIDEVLRVVPLADAE